MSISSLSLSTFARSSILRIQGQIKDSTQEGLTGRHADVGLTLGRLTGTAISYRADETTIDRTLASNKLVSGRLKLVTGTLDAVSKTAVAFQSQLITGTATATGTPTVVASAKQNMQQLIGSVNNNTGGQYYFSGTQTDVKPMEDGSAAVTTAFNAFLAAASATTGTAVTRANVTEAQMGAYLSETGYPASDGKSYKFSDSFSTTPVSPATVSTWDQNWSNASDEIGEARISKTETITTTVSANDKAFRDMAAGYAMITALGVESMGDGARATVMKAAQAKLVAGNDGITRINADVGTRLARIEAADTTLTKQKDIVQAAYMRLEGVDETEALLLVKDLQTQLDKTYAITGRMQSLSILNYL
ncbi:flagellar hook-associated family protein [Aureimonas pseudogalii]|uniref:Flagellin n=1 Tax=Aureimonas pseudogalii TaxID=1744844 RepID=A0A7W6H1X3_9HYPH|nr:flagellar hook-associated family protein [Aureimonas pseudogalii]MBB3996391.1 flagellar hook-associated protein 3 FlgL [Aureimonas pseudogalii]